MNTLIFIPLLVLGASTASQADQVEPANLAPNPGFEQGLAPWLKSGQGEFAIDPAVAHGGKQSARITVPPDTQLDFQRLAWSMPVKPGEQYSASFCVRCKDLKEGVGAYGAIEFYHGDQRIVYFQSQPTRVGSWQPAIIESVAPADADWMQLVLMCHAHGTAWFDDVMLFRSPPQALDVSFALQPGKVITDDWRGFGCQGDLFLYRDRTARDGVTDADRELIRRRITDLRPQLVRLLFQVQGWEPERGKQAPESEMMRDLRATVAIYQSVGADVMLTDWGSDFPAWLQPNGRAPAQERRQDYTDSLAAAVRYLREQCGFDNIRYLNLWNEPNYSGIAWEDYVACCRCLDRSLKSAGLRGKVAILGPDESGDFDWTARSVAQLDDVIDCYDVHNYTSNTGVHFARWAKARTEIMPGVANPRLHPPRKRLMITEFGMQEGMSTYASLRNSDYDYGLFLADCAIEAAKTGASALMMWCLSDTVYGDTRMKWGLWRYKDENWEPRPGFYAWSLITRYTERGSTVHPINSDVTDAAAVAFKAPSNDRWTLLAINRRSESRPFALTGLPANSRWEPFVYSRLSVPTSDRRMILPSRIEQADQDGCFRGTLPARSFILWRQAAP